MIFYLEKNALLKFNMFGINSFHQVKEIAEGYTNWALGREDELSEARMKICRECPLYNEDTDRCDSGRGINIKTEELVKYPGKDIVMGCGCKMQPKSKSPSSKCVLNKWEI